MKTAVIYCTMTGHSRKLANAIAAELNVPAQDIKTNPKLDAVNLLFVVGGIYAAKSDAKLLSFLGSLTGANVRQAALVTSCCDGSTPQTAVREVLSNNGVQVLADEYICPGSFLVMRMGRPNKKDVAEAVDFAKRLTEK